MMEISPVLCFFQHPSMLTTVDVSSIAGKRDDTSEKGRGDARTADARPAAVGADIYCYARRASRFSGDVRIDAVTAIRIMLPGWLRDARTSNDPRACAPCAGIAPDRLRVARSA